MPTDASTIRRSDRRSHGFSLIELLVVLILVGVVAGATMPVLNKLGEINRGDAGVTAVSSAVNAARIVGQRVQRKDLGDIGEPFPGVPFQDEGTAVIFTQGGEIRLVENEQLALDQNGDPLQHANVLVTRNGFKDVVGMDYVTLPRGTGIVGVYRDHSNGDLRFVPPPFAIRFNRDGQLITSEEAVHYDFDSDSRYRIGDAPPDDYNPEDDDPRTGASVPRTDDGRYIYPYEEMPTVAAVILFDSGAFRNELDWDDFDRDMDSAGADDIREWFKENGTPVYFSPLTGVALRGN